jgi:hypothetical protein
MPLPELPIPVSRDARQEDGGDYPSMSQSHRGADKRRELDYRPPTGHMYREADPTTEESEA